MSEQAQSAQQALARLADQAIHTAGDDAGHGRALADAAIVREALAAAELRGAERVVAVVEAEIRCWRGGSGHADRHKWISVAQLRDAIATALREPTP